MRDNDCWALVLAAGEERRLSSLTTDSSGITVPKQFCSLNGVSSSLGDAVGRAQRVVTRDHVCCLVASDHRKWWKHDLADLPAENVIVQPRNRGTANGILLPLLIILQRDPEARVVIYPSDHHFEREASLAQSIHFVLAQVRIGSQEVVMLGIEPDRADPELGYIVPGKRSPQGWYRMRQFIEKPDRPLAVNLVAQGSVWNSFVLIARGSALLNLFLQNFPDIVEVMQRAIAHGPFSPQPSPTLVGLYEHLPELDFSSHILETATEQLRVMRLQGCKWRDLGTPSRIGVVLRGIDTMELDIRCDTVGTPYLLSSR